MFIISIRDSGTPDVEGIANVKDDTVSDMVSKLSEESNSFRSLSGAVDNLVGGFTSLPTENAKIQPMKYLKRLFPSVDGGLTELAEELQKNVEKREPLLSKVCEHVDHEACSATEASKSFWNF